MSSETPPSPVRTSLACAGAIFLGAFLLFQVQPIEAKAILPRYGGAPAVWTTCMLFFQTLLLGGYAYAHATASLLKPRAQGMLHLALIRLKTCVDDLNLVRMNRKFGSETVLARPTHFLLQPFGVAEVRKNGIDRWRARAFCAKQTQASGELICELVCRIVTFVGRGANGR